MDGSSESKPISAGRARGHSLLSYLKANSDVETANTDPQSARVSSPDNNKSIYELHGSTQGQPVQHSSTVFGRDRIVPESTPLAGRPIGTQPDVHSLATQPVLTERDFQKEGVSVERSKPISIAISHTTPEAQVALDARRHNFDIQIRDECAGLPPRVSFLGNGDNTPPRFRMSRRSTLADKPELDAILRTTLTTYDGHQYLPLTATTLHNLSPYWKGVKPVADTSLFSCILLNKDINDVHADHVVSALQRVGVFVSHLLVVGPILTSDVGNVFNREEGNIGAGNDWDRILKCFPNLKWVKLVHVVDGGVGLPDDTYTALREAIGRCQGVQGVERFSHDSHPLALLGN
ncbi:hypothetical protein ACN47E_004664 [Coniothyrium glycines]